MVGADGTTIRAHAALRERFAQLIEVLPKQPDVAADLGDLMYGSHRSYSACGLGSAATDQLVALVQAAGPGKGLFGAKITGGGSGGTVAVFGTVEAENCVRELAAGSQVFAESGPGAVELGVLTEAGQP